MMQERSTRVGENAASQTASVSEVKKIQLLVIDLDGTTVGMSNQFQPAVKETLQAARSKGVKVAIATGRMYRSALRFHEELGLTLPLMVYQGALIKDPATGTVHRHLTIPKDYAMRLLDDLEQPELQDLIAIHCYIDDHLYIREMTSESQEYAARSNIEIIPVGDLRQVLAQEPTKILALSQQSAMIDHLLSSLRQRYTPAELYFTKSVATFFEATHPLVNKGTAVRYLAEEVLGLQAANVMAIGDNFNDLEMIEYAGVGVAMGNAPDDVKAVAHWVAPDVEQDGAAVAIAQFIL